MRNFVILLILVGLGVATYASRESLKDSINQILSRTSSVEELSERQPTIPPTRSVSSPTLELGDEYSAYSPVIQVNPDTKSANDPEASSANQPAPTLTGEQIFEQYDSGKISLEEAKELLQDLKKTATGLTFKGEASSTLIEKSKSILERVWKESGEGKSLTVNYTYTPVYDPLTDNFNLIDWDETSRGHATITIPQDQGELSAGVVYAATFMVLTFELTQDPNQASLEELQSIYRHATEEEHQEILRCFEELKLTYCSIFIAGYPQGTSQITIPTIAVPNSPTPTATSSITLEEGSIEWITSLEAKIHALINQERRKASLDSLVNDHKLSSIARLHSQDMARNDYFSHENLSGQGPTDRANEENYTCRKDLGGGWYSEGIAENIVQGYTYSSITYINGIPRRNYSTIDEIADELVRSWMASPGHKQNILDKQYDKSGIGVAVDQDGKVYATQDFC